jgi:hypothetical protein
MKQRIYLFDTTLRDGQQTQPPCPQAQPRTGKTWMPCPQAQPRTGQTRNSQASEI